MIYHSYLKIKDKICIHYLGHAQEYLVQLRMLRRSFEEKYKGILITYACRKEYLNNLDAIPWEQYKENEYAYTIPIVYDANKSIHPILKLIKDSKISIKKYSSKPLNEYGIICSDGNFPTTSLNSNQINNLKNWILTRKLKPLILGKQSLEEKKKLVRNAGVVVGVECDLLYEAIDANVPTALVPTGVGQELYELLCEKPIIINQM